MMANERKAWEVIDMLDRLNDIAENASPADMDPHSYSLVLQCRDEITALRTEVERRRKEVERVRVVECKCPAER